MARSGRAGSLPHLAARFFDVLSSRAPTPDERRRVREHLDPGLQAVFFAQPIPDQVHGIVCAARVERLRPGRPDLARAALLHDVGKRHARLGVVNRVLASLAMMLRLPLRGRFAVYRDHGPIAAVELRELGAEAVVWRFAAAHHHDPDPGVAPDDWNVLEAADVARPLRKPGTR